MAEAEVISFNAAVQIALPRCDPQLLNLTADWFLSGAELCPQRDFFDLRHGPPAGR